ncbi:hypothetical protein [Streptomyces noursei]|uniref:hypothetical protein n=1 Tax=Streptomyces noursei TaxID=1971 RepID=UPI00380892C4
MFGRGARGSQWPDRPSLGEALTLMADADADAEGDADVDAEGDFDADEDLNWANSRTLTVVS